MARTLTIAAVERPDGRLAIRYADQRGVIFATPEDAQASLDAIRAAIPDEALVALALQQIGAANAEQLEGKTLTLTFDVTSA